MSIATNTTNHLPTSARLYILFGGAYIGLLVGATVLSIIEWRRAH